MNDCASVLNSSMDDCLPEKSGVCVGMDRCAIYTVGEI